MMDLILYAVLAWGAISGFRRGAIKQLAAFFGVAVGLVLATLLYHLFGDYLADKTGASIGFGRFTAFVLIVVVVPVVLGNFAAFVTSVFKKIKLNFFNRIVGAFVGLICYALLLSVTLNLFDFVSSNAGFSTHKLDKRSEVFYLLKHATQIAIPDILIVTDSTEVADGCQPKYGLKPVVTRKNDCKTPKTPNVPKKSNTQKKSKASKKLIRN